MAHTNQVREFLVTGHGIQLLDVLIGPAGIITGASRLTQRIQEDNQLQAHQHELSRRERELERKRKVLESTIGNLRTEFESVEEELRQVTSEEDSRQQALASSRSTLGNNLNSSPPAGASQREA